MFHNYSHDSLNSGPIRIARRVLVFTGAWRPAERNWGDVGTRVRLSMCGPSSGYFYSTRSTAVLNDWRNGWRAGVSASRRPRVSSLLANLAALRHAEWVTVASARPDEADQSARGTDWNESTSADDDLRGERAHHSRPHRLIRLRANQLVRIAKHCQIDVFTLRLIPQRE